MKKRIVLGAAVAVLLSLGVLVAMGQSGGLANVFLKAIAADVAQLADTQVEKTMTPLVKEVAVSGTRVALVASETFARKAYLQAKKTAGANTGLIYIGDVTVDVDGPQISSHAPGDFIVIDYGPGTKFDLNLIYLDCAAGNTDGVTGWYVAP